MSKPPANIHDAFFKQALADRSPARFCASICRLVDLVRIEDRDLSSDASLRAFLKALKYSRRADLPDRIDVVLAEAPVLEERALFVILTYLDKSSIKVNKKAHEALLRLVPEEGENHGVDHPTLLRQGSCRRRSER